MLSLNSTDDYDQLAAAYADCTKMFSDDFRACLSLLDEIGDLRGKIGLDIGCGLGVITEIAVLRGAEMDGVDISGEMIEKAKTNSKSTARYQVISCAKFPFSCNNFDFAISTFCLCTERSFENVEATLAETNRVLKPRSKLGILFADYEQANGEQFDDHRIEKVFNLKHGDPIKVFLKKTDGTELTVQDYYHDMFHYSAALKRQKFENIQMLNVASSDGRNAYKIIVAQKAA